MLHFISENIATWSTHGVVGRDLDHDLVQILNDVLELFCSIVSYIQWKCGLSRTLKVGMIDAI